MADVQFNPMDPAFVADPYPTYHRLRAEDPVHHSPLGFWVLTRYPDVMAMLRDPRLTKEPIAAFVAARFGMAVPPPGLGLSMLDRDPPDHTRLRGFIKRIEKTHRYRLTSKGLRTVVFYQRTYARVIRPGLSIIHAAATAAHPPLARAFHHLQSEIDAYLTLQAA